MRSITVELTLLNRYPADIQLNIDKDSDMTFANGFTSVLTV